MLINSLKNKECTVSSALSTFMNLSKDLIDESKHAELKNTNTVKLDRNNLLKNENHSSDCSRAVR